MESMVNSSDACSAGFWCGKTVFLTGHTGFKGSWLSLWLATMGARTVGYALAPATMPSLFDIADIKASLADHIIGDVRDYEQLSSSLHACRPDVVIHMAAQSLVLPSYSQPRETFDTNVMGTVNLLEAVRHTPEVRAVIVVTSDKCYENRDLGSAFKEDDPKGGFDPYSNSKGCAELVTSSYINSFFAHGRSGVASARAGNVIGGGDWAENRLVSDIVKAFSTNQNVDIRNAHHIRPWQHVLEPLSGYLLLAERLYHSGMNYAGGWNLGPDDESAQPVHVIADSLASLWGEGAGWNDQSDPTALHEAAFLRLDCTKARSQLNWRPRWDLQTALASIVAWHKAYNAGRDMHAFTLAQIADYQTTPCR